jgi:hypothetical protein
LGDSENHISREERQDSQVRSIFDGFNLGYFLKLCALASWRENDPNPEKDFLSQRRKDAKVRDGKQ